MSKISNISQSLVERNGLPQLEADSFVVELFSVIRESLDKEKIVKVKGLGTFKLSEMNSRESVDVNTGERILIEGRPKITFTPENNVRDRINSPFAQFESIDIEDEVDFSTIDEKYRTFEEPDINLEKQLQEEIIITSDQVDTNSQVKMELSNNEIILNETGIKESVEEIPSSIAKNAVEEKKLETTPVSQGLYCEELIREELTHSRKIIKLLYSVLGLLIIVVLISITYYGYTIGFGSHNFGEKKTTDKVATKNITIKPNVKQHKIIATTSKILVSQPTIETVDSIKDQQIIYNKDARVRTGAYVIIGLDTVVEVKKGQTVNTISKFYLGEGMDCYVEVFNGGIKDVKPGDRIKIPKIKLKKLIKR